MADVVQAWSSECFGKIWCMGWGERLGRAVWLSIVARSRIKKIGTYFYDPSAEWYLESLHISFTY
jgi:hypothetical protein